MSDKKVAIAAAPATPVSVPIEQECCSVRGYCYRDPMHTHVCTIVLVDDPDLDDHESHACYCGDWWHDR